MIDSLGNKWYAIYTKYKCEKYVRDQLLAKDVIAYVPVIEEFKLYKTKSRKVEKPLINSFVFVRMNIKDYLLVLNTMYVKGFLKIGKLIVSIPNREIDVLKRIVGEQVKLVETAEFKVGQKVEILSGRLSGLSGDLIEIKGKKSFIVALGTLGLRFEIEVDPSVLTVINNGM